ncbi:peptidoglycan D,D-transpeptidase FtsI family protein [Scrofimicrobium canadense]|nr:penicillin-binding protein 2 [Scrofimicrobium canadense]
MKTADHNAAQADISKKRARVIGVAMTVLLSVCAVQLFMIQIVRGPALAEQGRQVRTSATKIPAPRGQILDANGQVMVDSVQTYHIAVNQQKIREYIQEDDDGKTIGRGPAAAAKQLAPLLKMDAAVLGAKMVGDGTYEYLAKNVDSDTYRAIRALGIYGIEWEPVFERIYPAGNAAANVLGTFGTEPENSSGLEMVYYDVLEGTPGEESYEVSPGGAVIPGAKTVSKEAAHGGTVQTTLHLDLQAQVQEAVDAIADKHQADWVSAVVLDVKTSKVLVLADSDLKKPTEGPQMSNAVQGAFEPGSVGKILTMATALEKGTVTPLSTFSVPGVLSTPDGGDIEDLHDHETYVRTVAGILTESSNTGTVMVGQTVSDSDRLETMKAFGLGQLTGIELPGETPGLLAESGDEWVGRDRYVTMFGQGYAMSALQQAAMMAAIGNDGVWQPPRIVDSVTYADGKRIETEEPQPRQAVSPETANALLKMMEGVVSDEEYGTGSGAAIDGYRVALKTGTAEILGGEGTVATTAGVLPADNPQIAISVVVNNPKAGGYLSSDSAIPLFKSVASSAVRNLGIPASATEPELFPLTP